jgi:putative phosphoesterase
MRIALISDTHMPKGTRRLPEACVERLAAADLIVHCGDLVSQRFLDELRGLGPRVEAVHGNVDEPFLRRELPGELVVDAAGARIGVVHEPGPRVGRERRLLTRFPGCDAIAFGHTHMPVVERVGEVWLLNPGSPTERRRAPVRSMLELIAEAGRVTPTLVDLGS